MRRHTSEDEAHEALVRPKLRYITRAWAPWTVTDVETTESSVMRVQDTTDECSTPRPALSLAINAAPPQASTIVCANQ